MPNNFLNQSKTLRNLVLSPNKQAAWGGTLADASLTQRQRFDGGATLDLDQGRRSDQGYSGKGMSFASNGQVTSWDSKLNSLKFELSAWTVGWLFAMAFGTDTVTGSASPYTHTFAYDDTTKTPVCTTVYLEDTEANHYKVPDLAMSDFTLTIPASGAIMAECNMVGTGRNSAGSMGTVPALAAATYLLGSDAVFSMGAFGAPVSFLGRHMNTTFKFDNQLTAHKAPGLGLYAGFVRKGVPKFSIQTTIAATASDDLWTPFQNDTEQQIVIAVNSGAAAQLTLTINAAHFKTTKLGSDGDMIVYQLEADETSMYQYGGNLAVSATVLNSVAAYLTAA